MTGRRQTEIPPMPEGFTDRAAWDAIHFEFAPLKEDGSASYLNYAMIDWQRNNQDRIKAALKAKGEQDGN